MISLLAILLAVVTTPYAPVSYACDGLTSAYTVNFPYLASTDLLVTSTTPAGISSTLAITTDYTLNVTSTSSTASLTLLSPGTKCPSGNTLKIARNSALTQPTSFRQQTSFSPSTVEAMADRTVMEVQQVNDKVSVTGAVASTAYVDQAIAATLTGGSVVQPITWALVGDGTTTTFTIPNAVVNSPDLYQVTIDGLVQAPTTDYTVSTNPAKIAFTFAPALNATISVRSTGYAKALSVGDNTSVLATGTSIPRDLAHRFGEVLNVKDFGAKGDGANDDTASIQAALDTAGAGGQVQFPHGQYKITATLLVHDGQTLMGTGGAPGIATSNLSQGTVIYGPSFASNFFKIDIGSHNVTFDSLKLWGKDTNGNVAGSVGIDMEGAAAGTIHIVNIRNCGFWRLEKGIKADDTTGSGFQVSNVHVVGSTFAENTYGMWLHGQNMDYWLMDNSDGTSIQANGALVWVEKGGDIGIRNTTGAGVDTTTTSLVVLNGVHSPILLERSQAEAIGFFLKITSTGGGCSPNGCQVNLIQNIANATVQVDGLENLVFDHNLFTAPVNFTNNDRLISFGNQLTGTGTYTFTNNSTPVMQFGDATVSTSTSGGHWAVLDGGGQVWHRATLVYSSSITPDARLARDYVIGASNGTAFTINAPNNVYPTQGQHLSFTIKNNTGGALGVATWAAGYHMAGAWVQPATGQYRTIEFNYDGTNWLEMWRSAADSPN